MNEFSKSRWSVDGDEIRLGVEFSKVDKKRRVVAGWATIDNVDTENDQVTSEASLDAFTRSRGNLREMHKKDSAVGRVVSYKQDDFRAPDGKVYNGIFVKVRVSEGAEDTWKKVLDGTLNGFSIGGHIIESEEVFNKDSNATVRKVLKYDLNELSLVDNPGNQFSDFTNIFKIKNSSQDSITAISGMIEDHNVLNVFYCAKDEITQEKPGESYSCPVCDEKMTTIGFVEDGGARSAKVNQLVTKYLGEGGVKMGEEELETVQTGHDAGDPQEVPTPANTEEDVEKIEEVEKDEPLDDVEEVQDESDEIVKKIDSLKDDITKIINNSSVATEKKIAALEKAVNETRDKFSEKINELDEKLLGLDKNLETAKGKLSDFEKKLDKVNSSTAFKKSADVDDSAEKIQKSRTTSWDGSFDDPRKSGAFSVNQLISSVL